MADEENDTPTESTPQVEESGGVLDLNSALQKALKKALVADGVARGLRECVKALDRRQVTFSACKRMINLQMSTVCSAWSLRSSGMDTAWIGLSIMKITLHPLVFQAHLCILAQDCDSAEYVRLVEALAQEHSINLIKVGSQILLLSSHLFAAWRWGCIVGGRDIA